MFFYLTYMNELDKMQSVITKKFIINLPNFVLIITGNVIIRQT